MIIIWNNHAIAILLVYVISRLYGSNHPDILLWLLGDSNEWSQNFIFITDHIILYLLRMILVVSVVL